MYICTGNAWIIRYMGRENVQLQVPPVLAHIRADSVTG